MACNRQHPSVKLFPQTEELPLNYVRVLDSVSVSFGQTRILDLDQTEQFLFIFIHQNISCALLFKLSIQNIAILPFMCIKMRQK